VSIFALLWILYKHLRARRSKGNDGAATLLNRDGSTFAVGRRLDVGRLCLFEGIPYAEPPVGKNRFMPPVLKNPGEEGVLQCQKAPPKAWALQIGMVDFIASIVNGQGFHPLYSWLLCIVVRIGLRVVGTRDMHEDCLYLSVTTPAPTPTKLLPVMVWFHGGDHQAGDGNRTPMSGTDYPIIKHGVILVRVQYRLGIFGFYCHNELPNMGANAGFLDQIASLKWVQQNIEAFGGDKNNVTIFGESAGGESVTLLMTSPLSRGLFHKAIAQSPNNSYQLVHLHRDFQHFASGKTNGQAFADFAVGPGAGQIDRLRELPASSLAKFYEDWRTEGKQGFYPVIGGEDLPTHPLAAFAEGSQHKIPLMIGSNADECTLFYNRGNSAQGPSKDGEKSFSEQHVDYMKGFRENEAGVLSSVFNEDSIELERLYSGLNSDALKMEFWGDFMFGRKVHWLAKHHSRTGGNNGLCYVYFFTRVPPSSTQTAGAFHAADLAFVFGEYSSLLGKLTDEDISLSKRMIAYWTQFATTGNPNPDLIERSPLLKEELDFVQWPKFEGENPRWIVFDHSIRVEPVSRLKKYEVLNRKTERIVESIVSARC